MKVSELPNDLLSKLRERFESDPSVRSLRVRVEMFKREMKFREALSLSRDIESLFAKVVDEYVSNAACEVEKVEIATMDIPLSSKEELMSLLLVCFMCADIIETSVMDMDDILHRYDKSMYIEMFNDIRDVMSLSKDKLRYLQENTGYMRDLVWADKCDNMYGLMKSKARSIMRKRKEDPNYGKNNA